MGSVIVITSGKGGTGKTSLTGGIGAALALQGRQVLCIDADVGLRNLDITLGMTDAALMDFSDVMAGRCPPGESRCAPPFRLWFVFTHRTAHPAGGFLRRGGLPRFVGGSQGEV